MVSKRKSTLNTSAKKLLAKTPCSKTKRSKVVKQKEKRKQSNGRSRVTVEPQEYEVERIIACRSAVGTTEYLVEWTGHRPGKPKCRWPPTWEPLSNLANAQEAIAEFEQTFQHLSSEELEKVKNRLNDDVRNDFQKRAEKVPNDIQVHFVRRKQMSTEEIEEEVVRRKSVIYFFNVKHFDKGLEALWEGYERCQQNWKQVIIRLYPDSHQENDV